MPSGACSGGASGVSCARPRSSSASCPGVARDRIGALVPLAEQSVGRDGARRPPALRCKRRAGHRCGEDASTAVKVPDSSATDALRSAVLGLTGSGAPPYFSRLDSTGPGHLAVVVAQSVRAPDCGSGGCGFKSRQPPWQGWESAARSGAKVRSSIGRAPVSKTGGWGFDSLRACRGNLALSSRGLGRGPLKAQTRVRIPLALFPKRGKSAPSSIGQDATLSRSKDGFDSRWGYVGSCVVRSVRAPLAQLAEQGTLNP